MSHAGREGFLRDNQLQSAVIFLKIGGNIFSSASRQFFFSTWDKVFNTSISKFRPLRVPNQTWSYRTLSISTPAFNYYHYYFCCHLGFQSFVAKLVCLRPQEIFKLEVVLVLHMVGFCSKMFGLRDLCNSWFLVACICGGQVVDKLWLTCLVERFYFSCCWENLRFIGLDCWILWLAVLNCC